MLQLALGVNKHNRIPIENGNKCRSRQLSRGQCWSCSYRSFGFGFGLCARACVYGALAGIPIQVNRSLMKLCLLYAHDCRVPATKRNENKLAIEWKSIPFQLLPHAYSHRIIWKHKAPSTIFAAFLYLQSHGNIRDPHVQLLFPSLICIEASIVNVEEIW